MLGNGTSLGRQRSESSSAGNDSTSNSRPCISHTGTPPSMTRPSAGSIPKTGADISSTWKNSPTGSSGSRISHPRSSSSRNKNGADARRGSSNRSTACGDGGNDDTFVSEALLREIVFEDYSRASSWERLQHQLLSSVRSLKIAVARHRFLRQVDAANAEAAVPPVASAPHQPMRAGDALINKSGSWHTCAEILPRCACACSSLAQEQQQSSLSMQLFAPLVLQTLLINPQHQTHPLGSGGHRELRCVSEYLSLEAVQLPPGSRRTGAKSQQAVATTSAADTAGALQIANHLLMKLPLFAVHSPQHEECIGTHVLSSQKATTTACCSSSRAEETADISGAAPSTEAAGNAVRTERCEGSIAAKATDISPLLIREYASHCLSSSFAFGDWTEANPHQGHPTICALQRLAVTAQYTYFLPRQWQHTSWRKLQNCTSAAAVKAPHEAWWLQSAPGNAYGDSEGTNSRKSASLIDAWREIGVGAATPPEDTEGSTTPTADMLLQLLLQQPCPFQDLHVIWCSPLQTLKDFCGSSCSSSSSSKPAAAALDCRLRLTVHSSLLHMHNKLLRIHENSKKHSQEYNILANVFQSLKFLQGDPLGDHCRATRRIYNLSMLLLACSSSTSNSSTSNYKAVSQQPLLSVRPKILRRIESSIRQPDMSICRRRGSAVSRRSRHSHDSRSSGSSSDASDASGVEAACVVEASLQQLFRPMRRQQQLLIHEQQVKRLLLIGRSSRGVKCSCCSSACSCCGVDGAFGILWGSSSSGSYFSELALMAGEWQGLQQLQRFWHRLVMQLRDMWEKGRLLPRIVAGLTAATVATCQAEATQGTTEEGQKWSAFAAARGISCCPDGPCALPDLCCTPLQQLFQQLNCAIQQRRLQCLLHQLPQEQPQQPFESLRFVLPSPEDLAGFHEPILPVLPPITEQAKLMCSTLMPPRTPLPAPAQSENLGGSPQNPLGAACPSVAQSSTSASVCTPDFNPAWWQHCFTGLPQSAEQLVLQGEYLLRQREATRSAAAAALAGATHPLGAMQRAAMAAAHLVTTEGPPDSQRTDPKRMHLEAEVEGEMALHGLESLTAPDLLGHLLRILVASLSEQCRLACACVLAAAPSCDGGIRRCLYTPGVAAVCFERSGRGVHATNSTSTSCRGALFPCHIPALQAAVDDLQRHAIAHAATIPAAAFKDGSSWIPSVALLAACLRCEYMFSAAAGLCQVFGTDPAALPIVRRALQLLLQQLQQQEHAAARGTIEQRTTGLEGWQAGECPDAECDILVPILSCSEKRALQHVLHRCSGDLDCDSAMGTSDDPWDVRLPWPPFAEEYIFLSQPAETGAHEHRGRFYCRKQHGDRAFAVAIERSFR
ncbi:LOW QUALITY PROTEIN: uncharacterized protein LOC34618429 [Cyclospora cayetanensis]|uniref:LOW QUALITY PROTEIN: uncharacterized protein LOC34618429 n=1 Tax=Cyclospora cayetanensis TaxID=88456 RepID=A0A6P6RXV3_9EIME|nr:LOW QUALITY PROTEIN: uncharacterized protein LOC34618429 [Cyclospora cayetanensis]